MGETGPQEITKDSYCLAWSLLLTLTRLINPEKDIVEIDLMIKGKLDPLFVENDQALALKQTHYISYLKKKYKIYDICQLKIRIENFILWYSYVLLSLMDTKEKNQNLRDNLMDFTKFNVFIASSPHFNQNQKKQDGGHRNKKTNENILYEKYMKYKTKYTKLKLSL
jgi:hypothetical protein